MLMAPNQELYQLIHSLDSSEQRSFKIFLNKSGRTKKGAVEKLYDLLKKHKTFDEDKITKAINRSDFAKKHTYVKHQLSNQIIDFLGVHHRNQNDSYQLNLLYNQIMILYFKNQISIANKLVNTALKLAKKNKLPGQAFRFLKLKIQLIDFETEFDFKEWERIADELSTQQQLHHHKNTYFILYEKLITLEHTERLLDVEQSKALLNDLPENPFFVNEQLAKDAGCLNLFYLINAIYYRAIDQASLFLSFRMKYHQLFKTNLSKNQYDKQNLIGSIMDCVVGHYILGQIEEAEILMEEYKNFPKENELDEDILAFHQTFLHFHSIELLMYANRFEEAQELMNQVIQQKLFSSTYESMYIDLYNTQLQIHFFFEEYEAYQALYNEHFRDLKKYELSNFFIKLCYFLSLYERGLYDLLESEFEGLYYIKRVRELDGPYFDKVLTLARRIKQSPMPDDVKKIAQQVLAELPVRQILISPFDRLLRFWLRDKVNGTKMKNVVKAV